MNKVKLKAPAKINLSLDILGLREDGYHELEMIMQSISLHDLITVEKQSKGIDISCSDKRIPEDENNLAYQAAKIVIDSYNLNGGVRINIDKKIPMAAGLAGGSTDAAAVLKAVDYLYDVNISREKFYNLGRKIGSDVPFCLYGGTAFATGRGDSLQQLPDINKTWLVIVKPPIKISTPDIYKAYDKEKSELDIPTAKLLEQFNKNGNIEWSDSFANVLEVVTENKVKDVKIIKNMLAKYSPALILMSGSGPSVFSIVENEQQNIIIINLKTNISL